ncbi:PIG-L deacetylase family protein [Terriglobus sp.]|uniref:PIG-L deacetylase family protein n=1 Tax=Terriglobus sp. TaxID=1889013 RepID=UPI003B001036
MSRAQVTQIFQQLHQQDTASSPRVLFVYAHPDDEAIAVGGQLPLFRNALFLQVTDGAPADNADGTRLGLSRDEYRATRALELRAAFAAGGLPEARHRSLNLSDKEAAYHLASLVQDITKTLQSEQPDVVFTHPYEAGHVDHDACAFAVHQAVASLPGKQPLIVESPFYFDDHLGNFTTGAFLQERDGEACDFPLTPAQRESKEAVFAAFETQRGILDLFGPALHTERFRVAPAYDFRQPPHPWPAYYQRFIPGLNPSRFCELATAAISELQPHNSAAPHNPAAAQGAAAAQGGAA